MKTKPILTDFGLCRVINSRDVEDLFQSSEYMDAFNENFVDVGLGVKGMMIRGKGPIFATRLVLDAQQFMREHEENEGGREEYKIRSIWI